LEAWPGGAIFIQMTAPDGVAIPVKGMFHEIIEPERLVFSTSAFEDMDGVPQLENYNVVTFDEVDGKTKLTLKVVITKATPAMSVSLTSMETGWNESMDRLANVLNGLIGDTRMTDVPNTQAQHPTPHPDLKSLARLVGTWQVSGGATGTTRYAWLEGGFFLVQHFDLMHGGHPVKGIEVIGHEQAFGAEPSADIKARIYDNMGNTFDYVYEAEGDTLTIWGGAKGSPAYFRGQFSADGNTLSGAWVYPDGGGYESTSTKLA
jgi:Activator of Hsp90 ATPase homolog 1-like protein